MAAEQGTTIDPGRHDGEPSVEELAREDELRSTTSVADLVQQDLDDPGTPSRRAADGEPAPDSFHVPLDEYGTESTDAR